MYNNTPLTNLMSTLGMSFSHGVITNAEDAIKYTATLYHNEVTVISLYTDSEIANATGEEKIRLTFALIFELFEYENIYEYEAKLKNYLPQSFIEEIKLYTWGYKYEVGVYNFKNKLLGQLQLFVKNRKEGEVILGRLNAQYAGEKVEFLYNYMLYLKERKYYYTSLPTYHFTQ